MPDGATIEIKGLDEAIKKLTDVAKLRKVHAGIKAGLLHLKGKAAEYPAETAANRPGHGSWYKRGTGTMFAGGGTDGKSETLSRKWTIKYSKTKFEGKVGNNASYAVFVQGPKKGSKGSRQAKHMARIGWKSVDTVSKEETKRVQEYVFEAVRRSIGA